MPSVSCLPHRLTSRPRCAWVPIAFLCLMLAACAGPSRDISRIPTQTDAVTSRDGTFTQPVQWSRTKPGCKGQCPEITVDSLVFPGKPELTELVDHVLSNMTDLAETNPPIYQGINDFEEQYWETAGPHDQTSFHARTRYRNRHLTVIELNTGQYYTGAAHGMMATRFLNWDNDADRLLELEDILAAGGEKKYLEALRQAHERWKAERPEVQENAASWSRMWPFQPNDNVAFTDSGLIVKYGSYDIAPYSSGLPELFIPYAELDGILKTEYLPSKND